MICHLFMLFYDHILLMSNKDSSSTLIKLNNLMYTVLIKYGIQKWG